MHLELTLNNGAQHRSLININVITATMILTFKQESRLVDAINNPWPANKGIDPHAALENLCGASGRTLRFAFEDELGLSPKRFLEVHQPNLVFRELRRSDRRSTKIADVASDWGFWHMGKLARDYRRLFGELPSEALARPRKVFHRPRSIRGAPTAAA